MKKLFLKIMALVLGLNVFTACYGPAPYPGDYPEGDGEAVVQNDGTKAASEAEAAPEEAGSEENVQNGVS